MNKKIKVAFLVVDDRFKEVSDTPFFGPAPSAVLEGLKNCADKVEVHVISCTMKPMPAPEKLAENIYFHGLPVVKLGFLRTLHSGCIRAVRRIVKGIQPDVLHAQGTERWCAIAGLVFNGPKVLTIHGNLRVINKLVKPTPRLYWSLQSLLEKVAIPKYNGVLCNSGSTQNIVAPYAKKTWRVDNPIRPIFFQPRWKPQNSDGSLIFLNVGVVTSLKRQVEIGYMFRELREKGLPVKIRFIGGSGTRPYQQKFHQMIADGEKEGFAEYVGIVKGDALVAEMDGANAFVHAPIEEAFGLVVAEALSRGLKLFTTKVGGIVDIIDGVDSAVAVEADDWAGMSGLISKWVETGSEHEDDQRERMSNKYSPQVIANKHIDIYQELLNS